MAESLDKLLAIASPSICELAQPPQITELRSLLRAELESLLALRNGFYAFESALHLFPLEDCGPEIGLRRWNSPELWRHEYGGLLQGHFFFAEDVFGGQFSVSSDRVWMVDPETGGASEVADSLDGWAQRVLADYRVITG